MTVGFRVFCPDTILPPVVDQLTLKLGPDDEVVASSVVCKTLQFNWAGGDMKVTGGGSWAGQTHEYLS